MQDDQDRLKDTDVVHEEQAAGRGRLHARDVALSRGAAFIGADHLRDGRVLGTPRRRAGRPRTDNPQGPPIVYAMDSCTTDM